MSLRSDSGISSTAPVEPQIIVQIAEPRANLRGFLVIDSTVRGRAVGGLRMAPDASLEETRELARTMTLKYAFAGIANGGAKASVVGDPEMAGPEKQELLSRFLSALGPLVKNRVYIPRPDMGISHAEITEASSAAGLDVRRYRRMSGERSGLYTGLSVVGAALGALEYLRLPLDGYRVALEGFGKVGSSAARLFAARGARVVAVSTRYGAIYAAAGLNVADLCRLYEAHGSRMIEAYRGAERIDIGELLELDVEVLSPCARFRSIDAGNGGRVRARIISAGANDPTAPETDHLLFERGRVCLPDFATNTGGMLGELMESAGLGEAAIEELIVGRFRKNSREILEAAAAIGCSPRELLEPKLWARSRAIKARAEQPSLGRRLFIIGRALYRCGLAPRFIARRIAPRYLDALLAIP